MTKTLAVHLPWQSDTVKLNHVLMEAGGAHNCAFNIGFLPARLDGAIFLMLKAHCTHSCLDTRVYLKADWCHGGGEMVSDFRLLCNLTW